MTFDDLLSRHAGAAMWRQLALSDIVGDAGWGIDMGEGRLTIGDHAFPIQLLGSEAEGDRTWLWAWANEASNLPEPLLAFARELRARGEREGIGELTERSFPLDRADGHRIGLLASGLAGDGHAYYRAPYDGGALFVLIEAPVPPVNQVPAVRVAGVLTQTISAFTLDHRAMARGFLEDAGFDVEAERSSIVGRRGGDVVSIGIDQAGRIGEIKATLVPGQGTAKRGLGARLKGCSGVEGRHPHPGLRIA